MEDNNFLEDKRRLIWYLSPTQGVTNKERHINTLKILGYFCLLLSFKDMFYISCLYIYISHDFSSSCYIFFLSFLYSWLPYIASHLRHPIKKIQTVLNNIIQRLLHSYDKKEIFGVHMLFSNYLYSHEKRNGYSKLD